MSATTEPTSPNSPTPKASTGTRVMFWAGCVISSLPVLLLTMSGVMKFVQPPMVLEGMDKLGIPVSVLIPIGVVEIGCVILYLIPQTSVLGAILLTGYLGGAIFAHVRANDAFLGPILFGILVWLGLFLRDARIRALIPIKR